MVYQIGAKIIPILQQTIDSDDSSSESSVEITDINPAPREEVTKTESSDQFEENIQKSMSALVDDDEEEDDDNDNEPSALSMLKKASLSKKNANRPPPNIHVESLLEEPFWLKDNDKDEDDYEDKSDNSNHYTNFSQK